MQDFDSPTGLLLPENFNAACETALVTQRANHSFHGVLMVVNVDHASSMNYCRGWRSVDDLLRKLAQVITAEATTSTVGRWTSDEFGIFATSHGAASAIAANVRLTMEDYALASDTLGGSVRCAMCSHGLPMGTVTIGLANVLPTRCTMERLRTAANEALYLGKAEGRNRLWWASDDL